MHDGDVVVRTIILISLFTTIFVVAYFMYKYIKK
jgi:hypothetical protein